MPDDQGILLEYAILPGPDRTRAGDRVECLVE